ncbi:MAG: hypothetical protein PHP57_06465 [Sideroxydans sp.]|nr:hypothetical protein [Sideroxydans sp.]
MRYDEYQAACGCTVSVYGIKGYSEASHGVKAKLKAQASTQICEDCEDKQYQKSKLHEQFASANALAAAQNAEFNLPALIGSIKQVAWAESIRAEKVKKFIEEKKKYEASLANEEAKKTFNEFVDEEVNCNLAKTWIDQRAVNVADLCSNFFWKTVKENKNA